MIISFVETFSLIHMAILEKTENDKQNPLTIHLKNCYFIFLIESDMSEQEFKQL